MNEMILILAMHVLGLNGKWRASPCSFPLKNKNDASRTLVQFVQARALLFVFIKPLHCHPAVEVLGTIISAPIPMEARVALTRVKALSYVQHARILHYHRSCHPPSASKQSVTMNLGTI